MLGGDVGLATAQPFTHVGVLLPAHPENVADAEVGDLQISLAVEQEIFRFDIPMGDAHTVKIVDSIEHLPEVGLGIRYR